MTISTNRRHAIRALALLAVPLLALSTACKKPGASDADGGPAPSAGANLDEWLADDKSPLTPEIEEQFLQELKDCKVDDSGVDSTCEAQKRWAKSRSHKSLVKAAVGSSSLGAKYIGDASPAIRLTAAGLMGSLFGADAKSLEIVVDAANKEAIPGVLAKMINTVGSKVKDDSVRTLVMKSTDHESERVRTESLSWLTTSFATGVDGAWEKTVEKLDKDPSIKVRAFVCSRLYGTSDERAVPILDRYLSDKSTPNDLYKGCFDGATSTWTGFPKPAKPSKKGYEVSMRHLEEVPRTKERPPWSSISTLRSANTDVKPTDTFGTRWVENVKGWYKQDRLLKALEALVGDSNANWIGRTSAIDAMKELGAPKATFERMLKKFEKADKGDDSQVARKLRELLKKL